MKPNLLQDNGDHWDTKFFGTFPSTQKHTQTQMSIFFLSFCFRIDSTNQSTNQPTYRPTNQPTKISQKKNQIKMMMVMAVDVALFIYLQKKRKTIGDDDL